MLAGKLYQPDDEFVANVNYQFHDKSKASWWGELVLTEYRQLNESDSYIIELQDGHRGRCSLRKRINRAAKGTPPLYYYHFSSYDEGPQIGRFRIISAGLNGEHEEGETGSDDITNWK